MDLTKDVNVDEALADVTRYIDAQMLEHAISDIEKNGKTSQWYSMFRAYQRTSDANLRDMYSYMMMMSPQQAQNYMREWTQKEIRNGVFSSDSFYQDDAEGGSANIDMMGAYVTPEAGYDKGMFTSIANHDAHANPEEMVSMRDFMSKFINHPDLTSSSRMVIIARLLTGDAAGRGNMTTGNGLALNEVVDKLPREYDQVMNQIDRLRKEGKSNDEITSTLILRGFEETDDKRKVLHSVAQLVTNHKINQTGDNVTKVIKKLTGVDVNVTPSGQWDLKPVYKWLNGRAVNEGLYPWINKLDDGTMCVLKGSQVFNPETKGWDDCQDVNEIGGLFTTNDPSVADQWLNIANSNPVGDDVSEAAGDIGRTVSRVMGILMGGKGSVKNSDLISTIVALVAVSIRLKTPVSRQWGNKSLRQIATAYLKEVKSPNVKEKQDFLSMVISLLMTRDGRLKRMAKAAQQKINVVARKVR